MQHMGRTLPMPCDLLPNVELTASIVAVPERALTLVEEKDWGKASGIV